MRPVVTPARTSFSRRAFLGAGMAVVASAMLPQTARAQAAPIEYMTPDKAHTAAKAGEIILIDIRRPEEWLQTGVAEGAIGLDMTQKTFVDDLVKLRQANPETPLAMICRTGNRTGYVTSTLAERGFPGLVDVNEGMAGGPNGKGWLKRSLPIYEGKLETVQAKTAKVMPTE